MRITLKRKEVGTRVMRVRAAATTLPMISLK
jgi:hypothetical protein